MTAWKGHHELPRVFLSLLPTSYLPSLFQVHRDGVITFGEKNNLLESTSRGKNPLTQDYAAVAAFYAPVFVDEGSAVFYRETQDEPSLERATRHVVFSFEQERDFRATDVFIATWHNVKCAHDRLKKQVS